MVLTNTGVYKYRPPERKWISAPKVAAPKVGSPKLPDTDQVLSPRETLWMLGIIMLCVIVAGIGLIWIVHVIIKVIQFNHTPYKVDDEDDDEKKNDF